MGPCREELMRSTDGQCGMQNEALVNHDNRAKQEKLVTLLARFQMHSAFLPLYL